MFVSIGSGISQQDKKAILASHNKLRQTVAQGKVPRQPGAKNMQEMIWDDELAIKAQQWATECIFEHDDNRELGRFIMGQNLGVVWSTAPLDEPNDFPTRIRSWFDEVQKYSFGAEISSATGHYSQVSLFILFPFVEMKLIFYQKGYKRIIISFLFLKTRWESNQLTIIISIISLALMCDDDDDDWSVGRLSL